MSNQMYNRLWREAQQDLELVVSGDFEVQAKDAQFDRPVVQRDIYTL